MCLTKKIKASTKRHIFIALIISCAVTVLAFSRILNSADLYLADKMYQNEGSYVENILVIGIDSYALYEIGEWPWSRDIMADLINILNEDEENKPAVIGVDVLYLTHVDSEIDEYLVQAASSDNVVVVAGVEFGTALTFDENNNAGIDKFSVIGYNMPFQELKEVADYGHINIMYDNDGVLRHHLWSIKDENGEELNSFSYKLYEKYCENQGLEPVFNPTRSELGFWWVDYTISPGGFYAYSAADIFYGEYDPEVLKDAIVIIGPYDSSLSDEYITPIDRAENMYGVEYVANVTNAMLLGADKFEVPSSLQMIILFLITFCCTMIILSFSLRFSWIVALILLVLAFASSITAYEKLDLVFMPMFPMIAMIVAWVGSVISHYILARAEHRRVSQTFGKYVDPKIMKELLREGEAALGLGGKTVDIAVLFVDIRGFTTMSEKLEPELVVEILNQYLTLTSECIKNNRGTLDKFVGDCTMAFWGAPLECENPIYLACRAAMDMVEGAKPLEEKLFKEYGEKVSFGVGVHFGKAVVGNIGAVDRMDYTAIGDTVNTSARLEANAPASTVYISRVVADGLGDLAEVKPLEKPIRLKGKEEGFEILELKTIK